MSPINIVSLSHSDDFDGIGSQAIIHRYFIELKKPIPKQFGDFPDEEVRISFFQADYQDYLFYWAAIIAGWKSKNSKDPGQYSQELHYATLKLYDVKDRNELRQKNNSVGDVAQNRIHHSAEVWKNMDLLILSDIGYNKTFKPLFKMLNEVKIPIVYFDHHNHDEETKEFLSKYCKIYEVNEDKCTTQLVSQFFLPDDEISKFIGDLGADTDFGKYQLPTSKEVMSIISFYRKTPHILNKIIRNYSQGINLDSDLKEGYKSINKWEIGEAKKMLDSVQEYTLSVSNNRKVRVLLGVSTLRSGRSMNHLNAYVKNYRISNKTSEIFLLFTIDSQTLNTNIKSDHTDVHKIAEHFGGGGHKNRAGFRFPTNFVEKKNETAHTFENFKIEEFLNEIKPFL